MATETEMEVVPSEVVNDNLPAVLSDPQFLPAIRSDVPSKVELEDMIRYGKVLHASGMFSDLAGAAQAVVKMIAGRAFGLDAIQSQEAFVMVQGRLTQSAKFQAALIKRSPFWRIEIVEATDKACELAFFNREREVNTDAMSEWRCVGTCKFTIEDAQRAGLGKSASGRPGAWQTYPDRMLYARCLTKGANRFCPHLLMGPGFSANPTQDFHDVGEASDEEDEE